MEFKHVSVMLAECMEALKLGFTSIMYDCSTAPYEENLSNVAEMVKICRAMGATVEGELGHVGDNEGAGKLEDGTKALKDGADELAAGMRKFDKEGIQKLTELYEDDVRMLALRLKAVTDAGKSYDNFSGIADGMKGNVKFIIRSDGIN